MNINKKTTISEEVKRFNNIMTYTLGEGHHYKFYEAEEEAPVEDPALDVTDPNVDANADMGSEPTDMTTDDTAGTETDAPAAEEIPATGEAPAMGGEVAPEGDTEIDVTELVNTSKELGAKTEDILQKITGTTDRINDVIAKVNGVEQSLQKMDSLIQQMNALTKQVELMRPATEEERRKVLAKDSYPFSVTQDEYMAGTGAKTQTDLENRPNKMSMLDNLMNNYNETDIKNSFYTNDNEKPVSNY